MYLKVAVLMMTVWGGAIAGCNVSYLIREVLLKNYDPIARPVKHPSDPVNVSVALGMKSLIQLDMKTQKLVSFGWLAVRWYDTFLTWDLNKYPVRVIHMTVDMVWRPQLVIFNTVGDFDQLQKQNIFVVVQNDGQVTWFPGGLFETFCAVDISRYPLDTQVCSVDVVSWTSSVDLINGSFNHPAFETIRLIDHHPEWDLVKRESIYTLRPSNYWVLSFKFTLRRKVMFYMVNMVLPIVLLSVMNCVVFLLPVDSGEKMTVSITVFLSFTVFMSLIKESLPQNSDSFCLFSAYIASQMVFSVFSTFLAAAIVVVSGRNGQKLAPSEDFPRTVSNKRASSNPSSTCVNPMSPSSSPVTLETMGSLITDSPLSDISAAAPARIQASGEAASHAAGRYRCGIRHHDNKQPGPQSSFWNIAWHLLKSSRNLTAAERRLLSRALDKVCLSLTVAISICNFLVFSLLMVFT